MTQIDSIIVRVKGIIVSSKKEWRIIAFEEKTTSSVFRSYLLPLSFISVIACYIGYGIVGSKQGMFGLVATAKLGYHYAAFTFINLITSPFITALIISFFATSFNALKNFDKAFKLVVYSYTPILVASILYIVPSLSQLVFLAGLYGSYLLFTGIKPMLNVPNDKKLVYFIVSLVSTIIVYGLISLIMAPILLH
jgi:hypothetical protein